MEKLYNFNQLKEIAAGNNDFIISLANIFLSTIPPLSGELLKATEAGDWSKSSSLAHKLKSTIDSMEIESIQKDIRVIEIDAKNKVNTKALPAIALKVDNVIRKVAEQLTEEFNL